MTGERDLRPVIIGALVLLLAIVALGVFKPPVARQKKPDDSIPVQAEPGDEARPVSFPLRSEPRGRTRPIDDSLQPSVGPEDGAPIVF
ncbi:MAG: hypothetical protein ACC682_03975 [Gemmatimonadota bacterium]